MAKFAAAREVVKQVVGEVVVLTYKRQAGKVSTYIVKIVHFNSVQIVCEWTNPKNSMKGKFNCLFSGIQKIEREEGGILFSKDLANA